MYRTKKDVSNILCAQFCAQYGTKHLQKSKLAKLYWQDSKLSISQPDLCKLHRNSWMTNQYAKWVYRDENIHFWRRTLCNIYVGFKTHPDFMRPSAAFFFSGGDSKFSLYLSEESLDVNGAEFGLLTARLFSFRNPSPSNFHLTSFALLYLLPSGSTKEKCTCFSNSCFMIIHPASSSIAVFKQILEPPPKPRMVWRLFDSLFGCWSAMNN